MVGVDAVRLQPLAVVADEVVTSGSDQSHVAAEHADGEGDVSGDAAAVDHQVVDQEAQRHLLQMLGQQVFGESTRKPHQIVSGNRTGYRDRHEIPPLQVQNSASKPTCDYGRPLQRGPTAASLRRRTWPSCLAIRGDPFMPGPYSSDHHLGSDGPPFTDTHPSEPLPAPPGFPPSPPGAVYPGPLPPPLPYPKRRRRGLLTGGAGGAAGDRRGSSGDPARLAPRSGGRHRSVLRCDRHVGDPELSGRAGGPRYRSHRPPRVVRHLRRCARPPIRSGGGQTQQRRVPQAVSPRRG